MQKEEKRKFFTSIGKFFLEREILCRATQCKYYCILDAAAAIPFTISVITFFSFPCVPYFCNTVGQRSPKKSHFRIIFHNVAFLIWRFFAFSELFTNEVRLFWWFLTTVWTVQFFCKIILFKKQINSWRVYAVSVVLYWIFSAWKIQKIWVWQLLGQLKRYKAKEGLNLLWHFWLKFKTRGSIEANVVEVIWKSWFYCQLAPFLMPPKMGRNGHKIII